MSHSRTVRSQLAVARTVPFGATEIETTSEVWPVSRLVHGTANALMSWSRTSPVAASRYAARFSCAASDGFCCRTSAASAAAFRAMATLRCRMAESRESTASPPAVAAMTTSTVSSVTSCRRRTVRRLTATISPASASRLASRKRLSLEVSRLPSAAANSSAAARRAPRYKACGSRPCRSQPEVASVSCRCRSSRSRSSVSQPRNLGQHRMTASCVISTHPSSSVTSRCRARDSSTQAVSGFGSSSSLVIRRLVSSVPSPSAVSRRNSDRARSCCTGDSAR
ncbi:hypothetical protein OG534_37000 [Streptomyces sp. NBC_01294]|nr:hypothetical protein [Streptomyces sp. NBC_01294]WRZ61574.1 hypothetical protein OG534_37000 [Streptomyces sp. NBC_01294]